MHTNLARRMGAAFLLPVLLAASSASAHSLFTCQYDQKTRTKCCCPKPDRVESQESSSLVRANCCDVATYSAETLLSDAPRSTENSFSPPLAVLSRFPAQAIFITVDIRLIRLVEEPRAGPPILQQTQSLLI
jgi:hypothetical protein